MAMSGHVGNPEDRDPRKWPRPGDQLKVKGKLIEVEEDDIAKPATVYFIVNGKPWSCGVFWWQEHMGKAEVLRRA